MAGRLRRGERHHAVKEPQIWRIGMEPFRLKGREPCRRPRERDCRPPTALSPPGRHLVGELRKMTAPAGIGRERTILTGRGGFMIRRADCHTRAQEVVKPFWWKTELPPIEGRTRFGSSELLQYGTEDRSHHFRSIHRKIVRKRRDRCNVHQDGRNAHMRLLMKVKP